MQRESSGYQECDSISWRQLTHMNMIITRALPLSIDVRKLPLANIPIIADIFGAGRVLRNYQVQPPDATDESNEARWLTAKPYIRTQLFPNMEGLQSSCKICLYYDCYVFLKALPPALTSLQPQGNISLCWTDGRGGSSFHKGEGCLRNQVWSF